jgi:hypothetical protein
LVRPASTRVVDVHPVDQRGIAALHRDVLHNAKELFFAVKAPVGVVGGVERILEFVGLHVLMADSELAGERLGIALVGVRHGGRIGGDGERVFGAERLLGGPSQISRVSAAGIGDQHALHATKHGEKLVLLARDDERINGDGA